MPKGRMLNKSISRSVKVATLSEHAAIIFSWSIPHLDSQGRMYADAVSVKGIVVPYLNYMTLEVIDNCIKEIATSGLITIYGDGKYIQFIGFPDNQRIDHAKEAVSIIPAPTPDELQSKSSVTPKEVKLSKVKLSKQDKASHDAVNILLNRVNKSGFPIYTMISRVKKQLKWDKKRDFPDEVLIGVCNSYIKYNGDIDNKYAWFVKVLKAESDKYHAAENIAEGNRFKNAPALIADILKEMK